MIATLATGPDAIRAPRRHAPAVYHRRRVVVVGILGFVGLALWLAVRSLAGGSETLPPTRPIAARSVVVRPGDTLWSIAEASGARGDIRPLVARLSAEVDGRPLQPGEIIPLP